MGVPIISSGGGKTAQGTAAHIASVGGARCRASDYIGQRHGFLHHGGGRATAR